MQNKGVPLENKGVARLLLRENKRACPMYQVCIEWESVPTVTGIDELENLDEEKKEEIMETTATVRQIVMKVCTILVVPRDSEYPLILIQQLRHLSFVIIHSTTITLLKWRKWCKELRLKPRLMLHDIVTCWNSTYYMLRFATKYREVIDAMMADKVLKLWKYELDDEEWVIVEDLVLVLQVSHIFT